MTKLGIISVEQEILPHEQGVSPAKTESSSHEVPHGTNPNPARFKGMNALSNWPRNRLLLALRPRNLKRLMPELEYIRCERDQILMDADSSLDHVFFPDSGIISVVAVLRTAASLRWQRSVERVVAACKPP